MYRISTRGLSVYYGDRKVLSSVDLDIPNNAVTALIGVSGCGKSTLLRCFNRMNDYTPLCRIEGAVELDGKNIYGASVDPVSLRTKVGMVFQKPVPFPMSIYDNVAYGLRLHRITKNKIDEGFIVRSSLERAGLYDEVAARLNDGASELSGGQQQRLCIARALAVNPEVLLMDEPCSALDYISSCAIEKLIIELKRDYTIIVVTHSVKQAGRISDNVAFLQKGRLIEFGPTAEVLSRPSQDATREYVEHHVGE